MDFNAQILEVKEPQNITTKKGNLTKHTVIVETLGDYPRKVCLTYWENKIPAHVLEVGKILNFSVNLESREYNGNWYTDVKLWRVSNVNETATNQPEENKFGSYPNQNTNTNVSSNTNTGVNANTNASASANANLSSGANAGAGAGANAGANNSANAGANAGANNDTTINANNGLDNSNNNDVQEDSNSSFEDYETDDDLPF